jgi:hypothetical protein
MKLLLSISFLLLLFVPKIYGQNAEKDIQVKWEELTKQLKLRSEKVVELTKDLLIRDKKDLIIKTNLLAKEIIVYLDSTKVLDTTIVRTVYDKNEKLTNDYLEILAYNEYAISGGPIANKFNALMIEVYPIEKAILTARCKYNAACEEYKMQDLLFNCLVPDKNVKLQF